MQNFVAIGSRVSAPQIRDFAVPFDVTSFFFVYWGKASAMGQPTRPTQPSIPSGSVNE